MSINAQSNHVYGYVLEVLTSGLYPNNLDVLREYVQNSYDAIQALRELGYPASEEIYISIEGKSIIIHDTGIGMDRRVVEKYRYFGYSEKVTTKNTGFRGIGKLAGLSVATDLEVITSKINIPFQYRIKFEASKMLSKVVTGKKIGENYPLEELIEEFTLIEEYPEDANAHYTKVILHDIKEHASELLDEEVLRQHISQVMPVKFDHQVFKQAQIITENLEHNIENFRTVDIYLNMKKVFKPYHDKDGLSGLTFYKVYKDAEAERDLIAFGWVMQNGQKSKGISNEHIKNIRVSYKGFMIGDKEILTPVLFTSGRLFLAAWFAGEIYVIDEELIPTSARDQFESNSARNQLYTQLREQIGKNLDKIANKTSQSNSVEKEIEKVEKLVRDVQSFQQSSLPIEMIKQKEKEIEDKVKKLEKKVQTNKSVLSKDKIKKATHVINQLNQEKKKLEEAEVKKENQVEIDFKPSEKQVYEIMTKSIRTFFRKYELENEEELLAHMYKKLSNVFGVRQR